MSRLQTIGLAALTTLLFSCKSPSPQEVQSLAECLRDSGATLYGTSWCGVCDQQKELFGDSFAVIPYIDCENTPEKCEHPSIRGYPTWILGNGKMLLGGRSLKRLAEATGCEYE